MKWHIHKGGGTHPNVDRSTTLADPRNPNLLEIPHIPSRLRRVRARLHIQSTGGKMSDITCPGSNKAPRRYNADKNTGWCNRCRDQHVLTSVGTIPHHNRSN